MKNVLVIGATSAIAEATAQFFAQEGDRLYLIGRNADRLSSIAADLTVRGAVDVTTAILDANDVSLHEECIQGAVDKLGQIDVALIAHGTLGDQDACEKDGSRALEEFKTNALSTISLLTALSNIMERQKHGTIAVISSVAGDRGRPSNYVYGSAKAAVSAFCEGLRARLYKSGVHVLTIKPGMVATPMTKGVVAPKIMMAEPAQVAQDIVNAIGRKQDVLYTPWYWRFVMIGIIHLPRKVFKKMNI